MDEITVPIYLITGFLESGKTSFLSFTLQQDYFRTEGKTLLILCEEGEEEYDEEALKQCNTVVEIIDSEEELTCPACGNIIPVLNEFADFDDDEE